MTSKATTIGQAILRGTVVATLALAGPRLAGQTVTNVRARQLPDKSVEVLYDLSGAAAQGATVSVTFSRDAGASYTISPFATALSGAVGTGVASGTGKRIVWDIAATLAADSYGPSFRAAVTATNPGAAGSEITVQLPGGVPLTLLRIPAGTFEMGSPVSERGRYPDEALHTVTLTQDYYLGRTEITQGQWQAVLGTPMSEECGDWGMGSEYPVYCVSWDDVALPGGFVERLNAYLTLSGQPGAGKFRLPTEAEWERAARAGTMTRFSFGDALDGGDACEANAAASPFVWWCFSSQNSNNAVGLKGANPFGLFDIHGNVYEWVQDTYAPYPAGPVTDPRNDSPSMNRLMRGGARAAQLRAARSATRVEAGNYRQYHVGFRIARSF